MSERKGLGKKTRFEVFKRDSFTCQYCGAKSPDVVLQVDHVEPVAMGGSDSILNLITSCAACNGGKGATPLSDSSALEKQRKQLEDLQERREQIDMMVDWQKGLTNVDDYATEQVSEYWSTLCPGWHLNEIGKGKLRKLIKKFGVDNVMRAMRTSADSYIELRGDPPQATEESQAKGWGFVAKICGMQELDKEKPHMRKLFWIRGILRRRLDWCDDREAIRYLENAFDAGVSLVDLESLAKDSDRYRDWENNIVTWTLEARKERETS